MLQALSPGLLVLSFLLGALVAFYAMRNATRLSSQFVESIVRTLPVGVICVSPDGLITAFKPDPWQIASNRETNPRVGNSASAFLGGQVATGQARPSNMTGDDLRRALEGSAQAPGTVVSFLAPDGRMVTQRGFQLPSKEIILLRAIKDSAPSKAQVADTGLSLLKQITERLPLDMLIKSPSGEVLYYSSGREIAPKRLLRFDESDSRSFGKFMERQVEEGNVFVPGQDAETTISAMAAAEATDGAVFEFHHRDGTIFRRTTRHLPDDRLMFVRENVTEDRRVRQELEQRGQQLDAILNTTQSAILGLDSVGRIVFANQGAVKLLDLPRSLPVDWPSETRFVDRQGLAPLEQDDNPLFLAITGKTIQGEVMVLRRGDDARPEFVRLSCAPVGSSVFGGLCSVMVLDDVSQQERNRQQLDRRSRLDALGQLTGGIAHDFNNLLGTIDYAVSLAGNEDDGAERRELLQIASSSVARGSALTRRLLAFAQQQPGKAKSVRVADLLEDFESLVRPTLDDRIAVDFELVDPDIWVFCDLSQLESALLNLVLNSRDAILQSGQGGHIRIKVSGVSRVVEDTIPAASGETPPLSVAFVVEDDGPGMSDEVRRRATDPFFTTKDVNSGTGLGLSMVYGFVEQAGGDFRIYSELSVGTAVTMILPRGTEKGGRDMRRTAEPVPSGAGQCILIVEDEVPLLAMTCRMLDSMGYETRVAQTGKDALAILRDDPEVQLVLTDVLMPGGMDGFELAEQIAAQPDPPRIVYMSGYAGYSKQRMGVVTAPLLQKPIDPAELARVLKAELDLATQPAT